MKACFGDWQLTWSRMSLTRVKMADVWWGSNGVVVHFYVTAALMEAEKRPGSALTLVIRGEPQRKDSHPPCDLSCSLLRPAWLSPRMPSPGAVQRDWGWLWYYFINYLFPLPPPLPLVFLSNEGGGATPFLSVRPLALRPPITADHCLNYSSLLSLPSPSFFSLFFFVSHLISSQIAL